MILTVTALLTLALVMDAPTIASAQDPSNGTGPKTLEEALKLGEYTVSVPYQNDQSAPYFMILVVTLIGLGIISTVFFIKGRSGKYTP